MNDSISREIDGQMQRLDQAQHLGALEDFEIELAKRSVVPDARKVLFRRTSFIWYLLSASALGLVVAVVAVLINFIVFTKTLHL